ncbi:hypothetical protein [Pseudomonas sp. B21-010]|uniref:hypothetical protein n=1 Tax=Pseudomonas sp. B21-010 TaxID=2895471 RepID=UPI00215F01A6|nr:hypothetical protein [Pseudomonas sp. B21-010]UVM63089.1 hypothetical protein LOY50_08630 [Pseudomonas sp. B21-010]
MGIKEYLKKLPWWGQLIVAGLLFVVGQIASTVIQTGSLPNWLSNSISWISPKLSSAASVLMEKTFPLWFVLLMGCLVALGAGFSVLIVGRKYRGIKHQFDALQHSNSELVQEHNTLKEAKEAIARELSGLRKTHADISGSLAGVKSQRDDALNEVKRLKSKSPSLLQGFASAALHDQSPRSTILGTSFSRGFRIPSEKERQELDCADILDNVMLCTIKESAASIEDIQQLTSMPVLKLESCLKILSNNNYVQAIRFGGRPRYQLTPRARKHFKCKENGIKSELSFVMGDSLL